MHMFKFGERLQPAKGSRACAPSHLPDTRAQVPAAQQEVCQEGGAARLTNLDSVWLGAHG